MDKCKTCERVPGYGAFTCPDCGTNYAYIEGNVIVINQGYLIEEDNPIVELTPQEWAMILAARKVK